MSFPKNIADEALVACGRSCCICHVFCGTKIELHHIQPKSKGGNDTFDNCIPLCFNCHADMGKPGHYKGNSYTGRELKMHRDKWYARKEKAVLTSEIVCEADKKQFEAICSLFANTKYILKDHDMATAFYQKDIEELLHYADSFDDPFLMFIDADLEMMRSQLLLQLRKCADDFRELLFWNEGPNQNLCVSHQWLHSHGKIEDTSSEMIQAFKDEVCRLTQVAAATWEAYVFFVKQIRFRINGGL